MSQLSKIEPQSGLAIRNMDDLSRMSSMLASSGYFSDAKDAAQCGVKVIAGLAMGIDPFSAMTGIHIIKGKPTVGAGIMAAAIKRHPRYDYKVRELNAKSCKVEFFENSESCGISELTFAEATAAGLTNKDNWKNHPKNMLFARCISNGVKFFCPDVFDAPVYTPEEMGAEVDGDGNVIDVMPQTQQIVQEDSPIDAPVGVENNKRFRTLATKLSVTSTQVKAVAQSMGLPTDVTKLTPNQTVQLEDAVVNKFEAHSNAAIKEDVEIFAASEVELMAS